jgi:hypothetical protein
MNGRLIDAIEVSPARGGRDKLFSWIEALPRMRLAAIENALGYCLALVRRLLAAETELVDIFVAVVCGDGRGIGQRGKSDCWNALVVRTNGSARPVAGGAAGRPP